MLLDLHHNCSFTLWGDEIFGRHALLSRGWGFQDKRSIEPLTGNGRRPGSTTELCAMANCPVKVRTLPLQQLFLTAGMLFGGFFMQASQATHQPISIRNFVTHGTSRQLLVMALLQSLIKT